MHIKNGDFVVRLRALTRFAVSVASLGAVLSSVPAPVDAYDPRAMTGPGFIALANGRTISGWLTEGNRAFYFKLEKERVYSMHIPAQNGFAEYYETGTIRPTKEHYCLTPFDTAKERCLRVRLLENNEFETTDDTGKRISRWWLAARS